MVCMITSAPKLAATSSSYPSCCHKQLLLYQHTIRSKTTFL
jgi:hypothetical protein